MNTGFLDKTDRVAKRLVEGIATLLLVSLLLWFMVGTLTDGSRMETWLKNATIVLFFLFLAGIVVKLLLSLFVKDKEEEHEVEELVDLVLRKKQQQRRTADTERELTSPLIGLDDAQTAAVCSMLQALPPHQKHAQKINLAVTAQFLTALRDMGHLEESDSYNLYYWVEQVTGRQMPSFREFKEAFPSQTHSKVNRCKERIQARFDKLR